MEDTSSRIFEHHAIFNNDLKTIRSHREDYEAKLESMLVQQQRVVHNMIQHLETAEKRMRELGKRGGILTPVPGPGPNLPRDPAPGVVAETGDDLEDSGRRRGAHAGSNGVGALWAVTD